MEMSVREARAHFARALEAAERGERVTITKNGNPIAELGPPTKKLGLDWARMEEVRREMGLDKVELNEDWMERFNDPAFSREVMGLGDDWDPGRR